MNRVLVIQLARLGDIVQSKRLIVSIAATGAQVHISTDTSLTTFTQNLYPYAIVHGLPAHATGIANETTVLTSAYQTLHELKKISFDSIYLLNASPLSYALARMFDSHSIRAYKSVDGQPMRSQWCKLTSRLTTHRATAPLNLVDYWAYLHESPVTPETVNPPARAANSGRVGIVMAGRESRRSLPPEQLAACVQAIFQARGGPKLICLGDTTERARVRQYLRFLPKQCIDATENLVGVTSLSDLPDIIQSLDCLITPDTGLMHLAAHYGVPVQAFFLSSAWCFETGPYGMGHTIWQSTFPCSPCLEKIPCPNNTACLSSFASQSFLQHLSGKYTEQWPDTLCSYVSMFDTFGVQYRLVDGVDSNATERTALRSLIMNICRQPNTLSQSTHYADLLFHESDWMLPQY